MAKLHHPKPPLSIAGGRAKVTFADVFEQVKTTCTMAQQCKDDGCAYPELSAALGKFIGGMAAMERRAMPSGSITKQQSPPLED